jgi:hypothetical protein
MDKRCICTPVMERIERRVERDPNSGCWLWTGAMTEFGYGLVNIGRSGASRMARVHRLVWEHHNGPISEGMVVMHKCDVPQCCNPLHLRLGTKAENTHDMMVKGRHRSGVVWPIAA